MTFTAGLSERRSAEMYKDVGVQVDTERIEVDESKY
jgi:hypothetical protein